MIPRFRVQSKVWRKRQQRGKKTIKTIKKEKCDMEMCSGTHLSNSAWNMTENWTDRQTDGWVGGAAVAQDSLRFIQTTIWGTGDTASETLCVCACVCGPRPCHIDHEHSQLLMTQGQTQHRSKPQSSTDTHAEIDTHAHTISPPPAPPPHSPDRVALTDLLSSLCALEPVFVIKNHNEAIHQHNWC